MTTRNWDDMGIAWESSDVQRQHGDHASDRAVIGQAQVPRLVDLDKAKLAGLSAAILKGINGTSWRVMAQDVARRMLEKNRSAKADDMRERVYQRLLSIRSGGMTTVIEKIVSVVIHTLPDGTQYDGTDEIEFRQEVLAQYIDMGVDATIANTLMQNTKW